MVIGDQRASRDSLVVISSNFTRKRVDSIVL